MSTSQPVINFLSEVMPYVHGIHLQFTSKKTNKIINAPTGSSNVIRQFFRSRDVYSGALQTVTNHNSVYYEAIHFMKTDKHPVVSRPVNTIDNLYSKGKLKLLKTPWNYFQRNAYTPPTEIQQQRWNYIVSGDCNRDLKQFCANHNWEVSCFISIDLFYSPSMGSYGYFGDASQKVLAIIGTTGTQFDKFTTPSNVVIQKILL